MALFDHLAVAAQSLEEGAAFVEQLLGVAMVPGGEHPLMGTYNRLLSLGPDAYLEMIAINPTAPAPDHPRWFDLDRFTGAPHLRSWVVQVPDLEAAQALAPEGSGSPLDLARGDLRWRMAVPSSGVLPFDGVFPALIEWQGAAHPAPRLPDHGIRLRSIRLTHPRAGELRDALAPILSDQRLQFAVGSAGLGAEFDTPQGVRTIG